MFFPPGTPVFLLIPWDVWNRKPSFSKVGSKTSFFFFFLFFFSLMNPYSKAQHAFSLPFCPPPPPAPPPISSPFSVTLLFHFSFTSHNIHYITLITRHCHANNLPSTEQAVKTQPKQNEYFSFFFSSFLTVYLLFKCRFVA